ncbi:14329_t:CDS:2, partial [Acaulospora morrowiae]
EHIRVYEMVLNYDGIYRMILVADVCVPIEREKIVGFLPVLEAFYNVKHRISELLTVIASNTRLVLHHVLPMVECLPLRQNLLGLQLLRDKDKRYNYDKILEHLTIIREKRSKEMGLQLPEISRKTLCRKTQRAIKTYNSTTAHRQNHVAEILPEVNTPTKPQTLL